MVFTFCGLKKSLSVFKISHCFICFKQRVTLIYVFGSVCLYRPRHENKCVLGNYSIALQDIFYSDWRLARRWSYFNFKVLLVCLKKYIMYFYQNKMNTIADTCSIKCLHRVIHKLDLVRYNVFKIATLLYQKTPKDSRYSI